jgi:hypothetical protein
MSSPEETLMQAIKTRWGTAITDACHTSSVPPAFLAALIANESGGNPDAKRFEPHVLLALWEVLLGRKAAFGSIGRSDLLAYMAIDGLPNPPTQPGPGWFANALQRLDGAASSWGLTQVMGYHVISRTVTLSAEQLRDSAFALLFSLKMLAEFATRFQLDVTREFDLLFACWNCGQPEPSKTFDPHYCANGLARMAIYQALA